MTQPKARTGGEILVDQLKLHGVRHAFCVPGESYLAVLDALHDSSVEITVCRQETGAALAAEATARLTGRPGVAFVTRGPGATNAAHAIHIAEHDSTPLILFVGQIERSMRARGAFQEMDFKAFFGSTAKWVCEIDDPARIPELVSRAFHVAMQGRPGPVVISLPEDMLTEAAEAVDAVRVELVRNVHWASGRIPGPLTQFYVRVHVTPRIAADRNISLKVVPEVSNIDSVDKQFLNDTVNTANIYAIRRIETSVEIEVAHAKSSGCCSRWRRRVWRA